MDYYATQFRSNLLEDRQIHSFLDILERTVQDLNEYAQGAVAELVFNLDEDGISNWEDRKMKRVVVPAAMVG
jgi:hypothetical protein